MPTVLKTCLSIILLLLANLAHSEDSSSLLPDNAKTQTFYKHSAFLLKTDVYGVPEGLSQSTVSSIVEDQDGYLWIGTLNGLNRFDGKQFHSFLKSSESGLKSSFIQFLYINNAKLYVGTDKGLSVFDAKHQKFIDVNNINIAISFISEYDNGFIIGSDGKVLVTDNKFNTLKEIKNDKFSLVKKAYLIGQELIIRNYDGELYLYNDNDSQPKLLATNTIDINTFNGKYIIDATDGEWEFHDGRLEKVSGQTFDAVFYGDKKITLTENELISFDKLGNKYSIGTLPKTLSTQNSKIYKLNEYYAITPVANGLILINNRKNTIKSLEGFDRNNIWSIHKTSDGVLVSDSSKLVRVIDENLNINKSIEVPVSGFKTAVYLNENELIYSTEKGVYIKNINDNSIRKLSEDTAFSLERSFDGGFVYLSTENSEVAQYDIDKGYITSRIALSAKVPIFDILSANSNDIYVCHQNGLSIIKDGNEVILYSDGLVYSMAETENGDILFGTDKSVYRYVPETSKISLEFTTGSPVFSIATTSTDIYAASIEKIFLKRASEIYQINTEFGAQEEYNGQSGQFAGDHLLFGGVSGISVIKISDIDLYLSSEFNVKPALSKLYVFNSEVQTGSEQLPISLDKADEISLKYTDYPFAIYYSSPNSSSSGIDYSYRMIGLDDDWIPAKGNNTATYTNLSPGRYQFQVVSSDKLSKKTGPVKSLDIIITPPWWLSATAKTTYAFISLLIISIIFKAVMRRREVQRQIAISEERLKLSLWGSGDEMWDWDIETGKIYRSNIWGSLEFPRDGQRSGATDEESNIHPLDQERVREALNRHFYGETDHFEAAYRVKSKDDHWLWILDRAKIVERDDKDQALRMTGTIKNINQFKLAEEQLRLFERAIENISEGMFILDSDFRFVEVNDACCNLCQQDREQFIGSQFNFQRYPESFSAQIRAMLKQQGRWTAEVEAARGDGSFFLMELTVDAIYDEQGDLSHYVGVFSDISRRKQQEEELRKLTNNDLLTGLPNRSNLQVTLGNLVKKDTHHTLMVLDLDNFKKINDSLGHKVGDDLLLMVSERILATVPDHTSLYRLGGDEFAILIDKNPDIGSSAAIAHRVIDAFKLPFELADEKLVVGCSIGIVFYPEDEQNEQALLRKADIAMYHAKSAGGNRYQFYSESLNRNAIRQLEIENLIREGLRDDLFEVYYQPKVDLKRSCLAGMEALVRLNHPVHGLIPPSDFIPLAEDTGLIIEIGELVMRKACFAAQKWREKGLFNGRVAINLSSRQFALPDLQQRIESILHLTQLPAANLELEITEGTVIKQPEKAIKVMQQLSKMGVHLALDDFGTGYSSLSYLKRFPIHSLKIDKAFVDDIDKSDRDLKMVDSIITIAHNMGLTVVGEGVEVPSQLNILRALNCEEIQGYIYSKALPEAEFGALLEQDMAEFLSQRLSANSR
ncbi:EAL domain-containing protein [Shewanella cyperi]|uniref:EAL domain-containing protein n=1 Tax=Shewanella cyperi TaxID=2814292 RepID=A0A974XI52_9GAMM|nr:EAL domain-containing protein [Shewanella cyperi]QSX28835.1 EAL domain-containing protein [Shewanella cyperi]